MPKIKGDQIPGVKNIFAIASGKGGVGKSTVTANIAVALSELGHKVGVIDADIYGPSMHLMFDLVDAVPRAVEVEGKRRMSPPENYGVKVLSIGFFTDAQQAVVWRGPMASKALNQLLWDAHWGEIDYLLVDLPPGTGDIHLSLVQSIPLTGAVVVSTPQDIALADVKKGVNMFQMPSIDVPVIGLIENMSYFSPKELPENKYYIFGKSGVKNLSEKMNIEFLGEIPIVQSVREAADAGRPAVLQDNTPISNTFMKLASKIDHQIKKRNVNLPPTKKVDITHKKVVLKKFSMKNTQTINKIEKALDEIRPYLQEDGGDIKFVDLTDDMVVKVSFTGACKTCPVSFSTLKNGVETSIKNALPKIKSVVEVD